MNNFVKSNIIRTENNIIRTPEAKLNIPIDGGFGQILFHKLKEHSAKIAQIDSVTDEKDTFKALLTRSIRLAIALKTKGVTKDDIICCCLKKDTNACIPLIASLFIGAKSVYIDPFSLTSFDDLLQQCNPKYFILIPEVLEIIEEKLKLHSKKPNFLIYGKSDKYPEFSNFLQNVNDEEEKNFEPIFVNDLNEIALLMFSSGTSSRPKLIPISHLTISYKYFVDQDIENLDLELIESYAKLTNYVLNYFGYNWISAAYALVTSILFGVPQILSFEFNSDQFWQTFIKYKPFILTVSRYQANQILRSKNVPKNMNFDFCPMICIGGDIVTKEFIFEFKKLFPKTFVIQMYGLTENFGALLDLQWFHKYHRYISETKPNSCGLPFPSYTYKVVDINTERALGPNQEGELRVKSKYFMKNYYNSSDRTEHFDSDGFFRTGDISYYDQDFCFFIVGRIKDLIYYKTAKIRPIYMEEILSAHPSVEKCAVIRIPNELDNEHPMALVILKENFENTKVTELEEFYNSKINEDIYRLRAGIKFVKTIPMTSTDKISRQKALKMVLSGKL